MDRRARRCSHCGAEVGDTELACPGCGLYYDGGFDLPDLIDGVRAIQPPDQDISVTATLETAQPLLPTFRDVDLPEPTTERWWSTEERSPIPRSIGKANDVRLPEVGEVIAELPYAPPDDSEDDGVVIDLRDPPARPRSGRSWLRSRSRT